MEHKKLHLLLADDDMDDCEFFKDALEDISRPLFLSTVNNGVELMRFLLAHQDQHPDVIFLDLNMPRKSGMECIAEIKALDLINHIPIIIYSTSLDRAVVNSLYDMGAYHYIQKPSEFSHLKTVIKKAVALFSDTMLPPRSRDRFVIQP